MSRQSVRRLGRLVAAAAFLLVLLAPAIAVAQTDGSGYPTPPTPRPPSPPQIPPTVVVTPPSSGLAFTGGNIALLVGIGVAGVGGGLVLVRMGRRRHATT
jgi:hypothetical protein